MASVTRLAGRIAHRAAQVPVLSRVVSDAYGRYFNAAQGNVRLFHGVFPDFRSALEAIPPDRHSSYDNEPSAHRVLDEWLRISPYDYPVLFWLQKVIGECRLLLDWGGNVGLKYFGYARYLQYPRGLTWCVADVPAVVSLGRQIAMREGVTASLRFTTALDELAQADVLLAAGSLHFIEDPFAPLTAARRLPEHVVLSKVPCYDMPSAVTLQNMGTAVCPYHLFNRDRFVEGFVGLGYTLVDEWTSPDCSCVIPFHPNHSIAAYSGFYFRMTQHTKSSCAR